MVMVKRQKPKFTCLACEDTGVSSKGWPCLPCSRAGRVKTATYNTALDTHVANVRKLVAPVKVVKFRAYIFE